MSLILDDVAKFITSKVEISDINETNYISTENMHPNKGGVCLATSLPDTKTVRKYIPNDILINNIRPYFKKIWFANKEGGCSNDVFVLRAKENYDSRFLYYVLSSDDFFSYVMANAKGTKMPRGDKKAIQSYVVPDFSIEDQRKISHFLSNIDEKIEINKQINKNLDNLIKILFKNFFEDFKPFENQEFKDSEIGKIPVDWDLVDLGSIIKIYNGYSYKGNELQESNCAMATIKNFNRDGSFRADGFKEILYSDKIKDHHFLNDNDVLISCTDVTQDADIIGNCILLQNKQGYGEVIMSMDLVKIESQIPEINNFLLASILRSYRFKYHILGYVNGTTVLHLDKKGISKFKLALPNDLTILEEFGNTIGLIYNQIGNNLKEIDNLSKVRDTLLPKLMSGEINVSKINCDLD